MRSDDPLLEVLRTRFPDLGAEFDSFDFLYATGSQTEALLYGRLLWPTFVEVQGMIFLEDTLVDASVRSRLEAARISQAQDRDIEKSFNFVEISSFFGAQAEPLWIEQQLADLMVQTWAAKLHLTFPDRRFAVEVVDSDADTDIGIVFFQTT